MKHRNHISIWKLILIAGLAGGVSEILWIMLYSGLTESNSILVARQVTASLWPDAVEWSLAPALGIAIHLALSLVLAAILIGLLLRVSSRGAPQGMIMVTATAMLAVVWAVNFLAVLPAINPYFSTMLPYAVTLTSKILFGVAMAWVIQKKHITRSISVQRTRT
jgi:hypothetical protein